MSQGAGFAEKFLKKYAKSYDFETGAITISYDNIEKFLFEISVMMNVTINNLEFYYLYDENNMPFKRTVFNIEDDGTIVFDEWKDFSYSFDPTNPRAQTEGALAGYVVSSGYSYENEVLSFGIFLGLYKTYAKIIEDSDSHTKINVDYYSDKYDYFLSR